MKLSEIISAGKLGFKHIYNRTTTGESVAEHEIECPKHLVTLAKDHPDSEVVVFGDESLGIELEGKLWAAELPNKEFRPAKSLPHEVWQYCHLAMGHNADTLG